jgi:hypothetical protein
MLVVVLLVVDSVKTLDPGGNIDSVSTVSSVLAVFGVPPGVAAYTGWAGGVEMPVVGGDVISLLASLLLMSSSPLLLRSLPLIVFTIAGSVVDNSASITSNIVIR